MIKNHTYKILVSFLSLVPLALFGQPSVTIQCDQSSVGMGRSVEVKAKAILEDGKPAKGWELLPYVNGVRWGSHEMADPNGNAVFYLPLPRVGIANIQVAAVPLPSGDNKDTWIWLGPGDKPERVWLQTAFKIEGEPEDAMLWFAVADEATISLNGKQVAQRSGWTANPPVILPAETLRKGLNVLSVEALNNNAPAGVLLRLRARSQQGIFNVMSDASWVGFSTKPDEWPGAVQNGNPVTLLIRTDADKGISSRHPWPTATQTQRLTGTSLDASFLLSTPVQVKVEQRVLKRPPFDPNHLIAIQWEGWFTPLCAYWDTAQAVPLMGFYDSVLADVARQHLIWFIESGVDCIIGDLSNNLWNVDTWDPTRPDVLELMRSGHTMLGEMARLREEGQPVPKMTFLTGVSHIRPNGIRAVNGQLGYLWDQFVKNPTYHGLWQEFDGKPLIIALDLAASYVKEGFKMDDRFTVRFAGATQDVYKLNEQGFWSWADWKKPMVTLRGDRVEAMTASVGTFGDGGWLGTNELAARGRRNGATLIEDWGEVMKHRPEFLQIHQFAQFAGALEGHPPRPNFYGDSYSVELSDDIEPTSLTMHAYRGEGGWGFYYLNLLRAVVDLYHQPQVETTVCAISSPHRGEQVSTNMIDAEWVQVGRPATSYTLWINDKEVARGEKGMKARIDLSNVPDGPVKLRIQAEGTAERYPLELTRESIPLTTLRPAGMEVEFNLKRTNKT